MSDNEKNLHWIQLLRGIAALLVVLTHARYALLNTDSFPLAHQLLNPGAMGVDLFFIISGFIMCYSTAGVSGSVHDVARFLIKRFARVWPAYVVATVLFIFVVDSGMAYFHQANTRHAFWQTLAMIPANPHDAPYFGLSLPVGWSLEFEMYFYLVFALCLLFRRLRYVALLAWVLLTVILPSPGLHSVDLAVTRDLGYQVGYMSIVTNPFVLEFVAGVLIGWFYLQPWFRLRRPQLLWHLVTLSTAFALWINYTGLHDNSGPMSYGWPLILVVLAMALASKTVRIPAPPLALWLGSISYSLYLTHTISQRLVAILMEKGGVGSFAHTWSFIFISTPVALSLAALSHRYLEQGLSNRVRNALLKLLPSPRPAAAPALHAVPPLSKEA